LAQEDPDLQIAGIFGTKITLALLDRYIVSLLSPGRHAGDEQGGLSQKKLS